MCCASVLVAAAPSFQPAPPLLPSALNPFCWLIARPLMGCVGSMYNYAFVYGVYFALMDVSANAL